MKAPSLDEDLELEQEDGELEELNDAGTLTLAEIAQAQLDAELAEGDFDWEPTPAMREPQPEPTEPAPPVPSEPTEPTPEPEQPEPPPPAPQAAPTPSGYFRLKDSIAIQARLPLGMLVTADEFGKIVLDIHIPRGKWRKRDGKRRGVAA